MKKYAVHLCSFSSGLDELPPKEQRDESAVLRALDGMSRVSVFEVTAHRSLANTVQFLCDAQLIVTDGETHAYPWIGVSLTDKGREWMKAGRKRESRRPQRSGTHLKRGERKQ
jgi:hypothetical protein